MKILKCLLMIVTAPVVLVLTLFVWLCTGLIYISGLVPVSYTHLDVYKRQILHGVLPLQGIRPDLYGQAVYPHSRLSA